MHEGGGDAKSAGAASESSFGAAEFSLSLLESAGNFQEAAPGIPPSLTWIRNLSKVKGFEVWKRVGTPKLGKSNQDYSKDQLVEKNMMFAE